jgi:P27 family predicted phage terminase small subunit
MGRGRKPLAPEVHEHNGSYRKNPNRENKERPVIDGLSPEPPEWFGDLELEVWHALCADLEQKGIQDTSNRELLVAYCTAYVGWFECRKMVTENAYTVMDSQGNVRRHPVATDMHKFREQMNKIIPEFGLSPSSRSRLVSLKQDEDKNPFGELLNKLQERGSN